MLKTKITISFRSKCTQYEYSISANSDVAKQEKVQACVPFISHYSDCTDANRCTGCNQCTCTVDGEWSCNKVTDCQSRDHVIIDEEDFDAALTMMSRNIQERERNKLEYHRAPKPVSKSQDDVLDTYRQRDFNQEISEILSQYRRKRSVKDTDVKVNDSVKFYHTVDEINEDTLKDSNVTGTLQAKKVDAIKQSTMSRRIGTVDRHNKSASIPLHIEYNNPNIYSHITDNKIDTSVHSEDKIDLLGQQKISNLIGNITQKVKDIELSKLVVNELKSGTEIIGDRKAPVMSNITFTPENDTLTAMAFIAGNLLNRLWNIEKDSSDEIESEIMKHEKISDLLDLFKEPLTMRQENFLKNALDKLSDAINKNKEVDNISLCEEVEETKRILKNANVTEKKLQDSKSNCKNRKKAQELRSSTTEKAATKDAIAKITNVLNLIKKFEAIGKRLNELKKPLNKDSKEKKQTFESEEAVIADKHKQLTGDEKVSLNLFGNVLQKITKLLIPDKSNKKIINKIKQQRLLGDNNDFTVKYKDLFKVVVENATLTAKDKLILDYISKAETAPHCFFSGTSEHTNIDFSKSNILNNLSEFLKIKSYIDLIKLVEPEENDPLRVYTTATENSVQSTSTTEVHKNVTNVPKNFENTKEKLKVHLKNIIDDLIEIQREKGLSTNDSDVKISDALPCLYNLLNNNKELHDKALPNFKKTPLQKVKEVFDLVKQEVNYPQTRRTDVIFTQRPKSAVVLERMVKNLIQKQKQTRRNFDAKIPKTYEDLKKAMDQIKQLNSEKYKPYAFLAEVPPSERLMLLKTLSLDIKQYIDVLEDIELSVDSLRNLPVESCTNIRNFVESVATNISLNEQVVNKLNQPPSTRRLFIDEFDSKVVQASGARTDLKPELWTYKENFKVTRDQILNQLIKNRIQLYLKMKSAKGFDLASDVYYDIAKRILMNLENGNYALARELYKVFVSHNSQLKNGTNGLGRELNRNIPITLPYKQPLIQFEEPKIVNDNQMETMTQEYFLKQLMNLKNLRI